MRHETLHLNSNRAYVLVNNTWYDTRADFETQVGQNFLNGRVERVLSYEDYTAEFPEAKDEIYPYVVDKTMDRGYIRRAVDGLVKYALNPATPRVSSMGSSDMLAD